MKWLSAYAAVIAVMAMSSLAPPAAPAPARGCNLQSLAQTSLIMDGDLWGMVRSQNGRFLFTWSGDPPVLDLEEAAHLTKLLGFSGSDVEIARFLVNVLPIVGGDSVEDYFYLACPGAYRLTAVVRHTGHPGFQPTRIWLHQEQGSRVIRSFCMTPVRLPFDGRISVAFQVPLRTRTPRYEIDRDGDGVFERSGRFRRGGATFPSAGARC